MPYGIRLLSVFGCFLKYIMAKVTNGRLVGVLVISMNVIHQTRGNDAARHGHKLGIWMALMNQLCVVTPPSDS